MKKINKAALDRVFKIHQQLSPLINVSVKSVISKKEPSKKQKKERDMNRKAKKVLNAKCKVKLKQKSKSVKKGYSKKKIVPLTKKQSKLVKENMGYVSILSRNFYNFKIRQECSIDYDDLYSAGCEGLIESSKKFNSKMTANFKTFAKHRIIGSIKDFLRSQDYLTRSVRIKKNKIEQAKQKLINQNIQEPTDQQIAEYLKIDIKLLYKWTTDFVEVGQNISKEENQDLIEIVPDRFAKDPREEIYKKELVEIINKELLKFNPIERAIIKGYYSNEMTMSEIGKMLDLTESRVSQIHKNVINRIKERMDNKTISFVELPTNKTQYV